MTDLHRSSVLPNVQVEATLPRILAAPISRAFVAMPALEANFLLSLLGFVAVVGLLLFILTPVPLPAIGLGVSTYAFLPLVTGSIVWVLVTVIFYFAKGKNLTHADTQPTVVHKAEAVFVSIVGALFVLVGGLFGSAALMSR